MCESVSDMLIAWGCGAFVEKFIENEVDIEALKLLDDAQIRILIPAIGPQAKFKKALSDWKALQVNIISDDAIDNLVFEYGKDVGGLTPSLCSPLGSLTSSPSTSVSSIPSTSVSSGQGSCIHAQYSDLTTLLDTTPDGQVLVKLSEQPLGEQYRKILVREIAREIVKCNPKATVTADKYVYWQNEIKKVFPKENSSIYYTQSRGGLQRAHGRLYDAVTNLKAKYRRSKIYEPRARRSLEQILTSKPSTSTSSQRPALDLKDFDTTADVDEVEKQKIEECLEWLRSSADNYSICSEKWEITNKERLQRVLSGEKNSYIHEFPCLKRSWGYTLLIADFDKWYPDNENSFEDKFPLLKNKLMVAAEKIPRKSSFVADLKRIACDSDPEASNLAVLLLIPHLLGPVYIKKKKSSAAEVRESFILHVHEEDQLKEEQKKRRDTLKPIQPYIVVVGPLDKIIAKYIVVDDITYEMQSINQTVDTCFKIVWALYLEYPVQSLPVWQFLQRAIYKFANKIVPKEKVSPSVLGLISDCGISSN